VLRKNLPSGEALRDRLSQLEPPLDAMLRDLWERLLETYPEWRLMTDAHLAVIYGVHVNTLRSRRHALALVMHNQCVHTDDQIDAEEVWLLNHCLRLKIGQVRKTDIHRTGFMDVTRNEIVTNQRPTGERSMLFDDTGGFSFPQMELVTQPLDREFRAFRLRPRCPYVDEDNRQCVFTQAECPFPEHKPTI
jgi:hypothetical protein